MSTAYAFEVPCITGVKNTKASKCNFTPKNCEKGFLIPSGTSYTHTELLAIAAKLQAQLKEDDKDERIYLIERFVDVEDKSTEATYKDYANGERQKLRDGKYGYRWTYKDGGVGLHSKIKSFDGLQGSYDWVFIDTKNRGLIMVKEGNLGAKGFSLSMIDVPNMNMATFADPSEFYFELGFADSDEFNKTMVFVPFTDDFDFMNDLSSLYDTEIGIHTAMTSGGLVKLKFTTSNGAVDLYDNYNGELDTASLYDAYNVATGAVITITSVTAVAATKSLNVQLDATDTDFPATAGALVKITFGTVSDIESAGMPGFSEAEIITPRG